MAVIPVGSDLTSITIDVDDLSTTSDYSGSHEFTFPSSVSIVSGSTYAIVVDTSGVNTEFPVIWGQHTSDNYAGGTRCYSFDDGATWTSYPTRDNWFITKASGVAKDSNDDAVSSVLSIPVITEDQDIGAQTFTASSSYTLTSVELKLWKKGTIGTVTVSIRDATDTPTKATNPTPSDAATDTTLDQATVTWEDGGGSDSYNVYYGDTSGDLTLLESGVTDLSYTISGITLGSPFDYVITRYWRIDSVNAAGTTTGDEWSFTTIQFDPPIPSGMTFGGDPDTPPTGTPTGENNMYTTRILVAAANNKFWYEDL